MYRFFFFKDTAPPEIYTLPLHDPLPISLDALKARGKIIEINTAGLFKDIGELYPSDLVLQMVLERRLPIDRKSTRLNSSHANISYAVFCLKKKKTKLVLYTLSY